MRKMTDKLQTSCIHRTKRMAVLYATAVFPLFMLIPARLCAQSHISHVPFSDVDISDDFWSPRLDRHSRATLPVCIYQIEQATGRIHNFENASRTVSDKRFPDIPLEERASHSGIYFDDSDVYKAMEGMAYSLMSRSDKEIEAKLDYWVSLIGGSQWNDGYINTYYTITNPSGRWQDMDRHEMYCIGHLLEAGIAYYQATGKRELLDICRRVADHIGDTFGSGKRHWVSGHEEIELALVKLYACTGEMRYLNLAHRLLDERGRGLGRHLDADWGNTPWDKLYHQDEVPVVELRNAGGHAVRLMYLLCGMADVSSLHPDADYTEALRSLWDDVTKRNMYITGGIGQSNANEGFTEDYSLPNETAYCETCASVGLVLWSQRMFELSCESEYVDVLERTLYNALLAGINLRGDRFFYVNPLSSNGGHHRQEWYGCACCPSNLSRFLPSIGNYIYSVDNKSLWVNLFIGNESTFSFADTQSGSSSVSLQTDYPWNGKVRIQLKGGDWKGKYLRVRIPGWCEQYTISVNGKHMRKPREEKGYAVLSNKWKVGDTVELSMEMPVRVSAADPRVKEDAGLRAVERGPLVYCSESADNKLDIDNLILSEDTKFSPGERIAELDNLHALVASTSSGTFTLIPYYAWDNRGEGKMRVWQKWSAATPVAAGKNQ